MSSSSSAVPTAGPVTASTASWAPPLDLTPVGLRAYDPARVQAAVEEGYDAGFQAGRAEALARAAEDRVAWQAEFAAETQALLQAIAATGDRLARGESATAEAYAAAAAPAAVAIAASILGRELADETVAAVAAVERVLATVDRRDTVHVTLHPDDVEALAAHDLPPNVHLEGNPGLRRGDATARTDDRTVDARIETALARACAALEGGS